MRRKPWVRQEKFCCAQKSSSDPHFTIYNRNLRAYIVGMSLSHHDPERPAIYDARIREFGRLWKSGAIGDATFLRSLFIMGKLPDEANTELNLLKLEKKQPLGDNP